MSVPGDHQGRNFNKVCLCRPGGTSAKLARKRKRKDSSAESTYSEISIVNAEPQTTELPVSQKPAVTSGGSKVRAETVVIVVLSALLAAAVVALGFIYYENLQTTERLQKLTDEHEAVKKNLTVEPTLICECGWEQHGKKCYYFSSNESNWLAARHECRLQGGDLVQIDSREEQSFLECKLREKMKEAEDKFWIGLTDSQKEGTWLWVDGSPLNESLTFWNPREPDNWIGRDADGEDCARMGEKAGAADLKCWFDQYCIKPQRHICEKSGHLMYN
ncbi:galactose-specific lectin nattectin-like [Symphorus nematophorus]